jgi:hypothetical protein
LTLGNHFRATKRHIPVIDGATALAFAMLCNLEESKFNALQNELARGKAPLALAKPILSQWGDFQDVQTLCSPCSSPAYENRWLWAKWESKCTKGSRRSNKPDIRAWESQNLDVFQEWSPRPKYSESESKHCGKRKKRAINQAH